MEDAGCWMLDVASQFELRADSEEEKGTGRGKEAEEDVKGREEIIKLGQFTTSRLERSFCHHGTGKVALPLSFRSQPIILTRSLAPWARFRFKFRYDPVLGAGSLFTFPLLLFRFGLAGLGRMGATRSLMLGLGQENVD
ncbi:hypothetical protein KQX54_002150 [Cotesia glomerata]|uniref:Uncharacterized protein n=1 Tax=Cotesia glomerata TaxID=32391 RepID=A0AAV7I4F5_COTGL|nr:hypothetical protein KQX54_002150 [Cotesia glomerata]